MKGHKLQEINIGHTKGHIKCAGYK